MKTVTPHQARAQLADWLAQVERGETIVITSAGAPIAQLAPYAQPRQGGQHRGHIRVSSKVDAPFPSEINAAFEGGAS